ncbi:UNVERIFIED_CONTAM: hypothetical protein RMT77_002247 [Armadillidium vulgare]
MSFTMEMPIDKESAKRVLARFMEFASNIKYMKEFKKAVEILYGNEFDVKLDLSNRMCFSCDVCHKEMNNVKSLVEHSISGSHLKSKDLIHGNYVRSLPQRSSYVSPRSSENPLLWKIKDSAVKIIGLQYVEAYDDGRGRFYYKCNLCGAHGKADGLYYHLIGDKHTDKYIKMRVKLNNVVYGPTERAKLRHEVAKREHFNVDDIVTMKGKLLYPYKWEIDGGGRAKPKNKKKEFDFDLLKNRNVDTLTKSLSLQEKEFMSYEYFETILLKFNAVVQVHLNDASDIHSPKDLRFAMAIHFYILHLIFYAYKSLGHKYQSPEEIQFFNDQNTHITKAMGCLRHKLCEVYTKKYSKVYGDLPLAFNSKK